VVPQRRRPEATEALVKSTSRPRACGVCDDEDEEAKRRADIFALRGSVIPLSRKGMSGIARANMPDLLTSTQKKKSERAVAFRLGYFVRALVISVPFRHVRLRGSRTPRSVVP
jgi:hypothetical protein